MRAGGARPLAAWLGAFALLGQLLLPILFDAAATPAHGGRAYADFVRSFGSAVHLCAVPAGARNSGRESGKPGAGDPLQCPLCQSFVVLGGLLAPASPALPPPSAAAEGPRPRGPAVSPRARTFAFVPEARGPPRAA